MMSSGPTCSIFCFHTPGRTHSNRVSAPHSAHAPMAHLHCMIQRGLSRRSSTDLVASVSWLSSVARKASPAPERTTEGHIEEVPPPHESEVSIARKTGTGKARSIELVAGLLCARPFPLARPRLGGLRSDHVVDA